MNIRTTMPENEIKCELSQAYVHAVVSRLGCVCQWANRQLDNLGIDAIVRFEGSFPKHPEARNSLTLDVQVKSTSQNLEFDASGERIIFDGLTKNVYDRFRDKNRSVPALLVLLSLPNDSQQWLRLSEEELILKKCAYWVSLKGAPECSGETKRIFFPKKQLFNVDQLKHIICTLAMEGEFLYDN